MNSSDDGPFFQSSNDKFSDAAMLYSLQLIWTTEDSCCWLGSLSLRCLLLGCHHFVHRCSGRNRMPRQVSPNRSASRSAMDSPVHSSVWQAFSPLEEFLDKQYVCFQRPSFPSSFCNPSEPERLPSCWTRCSHHRLHVRGPAHALWADAKCLLVVRCVGSPLTLSLSLSLLQKASTDHIIQFQ